MASGNSAGGPAQRYLVDPEDKTVYDAQGILNDPEKAKVAQQRGLYFVDDAEAAQLQNDKRFDTPLGTAASFVAGYGKGATFGGSTYLLKGLGVDEKDLKSLERANPAAFAAGDISSFISPNAVAKVAAKGAAKLIGRSVAKEAAEKVTAKAAAKAATTITVAPATRTIKTPVQLVDDFAENAGDFVADKFVSRGAIKPGQIANGGELATRGFAGSLAHSVIKGGVRGAVDNAAYGVGQMVHESALGDAELSSEYIMSRVGVPALLGGALGAAIPGAGGLAKQAFNLVKASPKANAVANAIKNAADGEMPDVGASQITISPKQRVVANAFDMKSPQLNHSGMDRRGNTEINNRFFNTVNEITLDDGLPIALPGASKQENQRRLFQAYEKYAGITTETYANVERYAAKAPVTNGPGLFRDAISDIKNYALDKSGTSPILNRAKSILNSVLVKSSNVNPTRQVDDFMTDFSLNVESAKRKLSSQQELLQQQLDDVASYPARITTSALRQADLGQQLSAVRQALKDAQSRFDEMPVIKGIKGVDDIASAIDEASALEFKYASDFRLIKKEIEDVKRENMAREVIPNNKSYPTNKKLLELEAQRDEIEKLAEAYGKQARGLEREKLKQEVFALSAKEQELQTLLNRHAAEERSLRSIDVNKTSEELNRKLLSLKAQNYAVDTLASTMEKRRNEIYAMSGGSSAAFRRSIYDDYRGNFQRYTKGDKRIFQKLMPSDFLFPKDSARLMGKLDLAGMLSIRKELRNKLDENAAQNPKDAQQWLYLQLERIVDGKIQKVVERYLSGDDLAKFRDAQAKFHALHPVVPKIARRSDMTAMHDSVGLLARVSAASGPAIVGSAVGYASSDGDAGGTTLGALGGLLARQAHQQGIAQYNQRKFSNAAYQQSAVYKAAMAQTVAREGQGAAKKTAQAIAAKITSQKQPAKQAASRAFIVGMSKASRDSYDEKHKEAMRYISALQSANEQQFKQQLAYQIDYDIGDELPHVGEYSKMIAERAYARLQKVMPNVRPSSSGIVGLASKTAMSKPSKTELERFSRVLDAIQDPQAELERAARGEISIIALDAIKDVYPNLYADISAAVVSNVMDELEKQGDGATITAENRALLDFFAPSLDRSLERDFLRKLHPAQTQAQPAPGVGGGGSAGSPVRPPRDAGKPGESSVALPGGTDALAAQLQPGGPAR